MQRFPLGKLALCLVLLLAAFIQFTVVNGTRVSDPFRADAGDYYSYAHNMKFMGTYSRAPTWAQPTAPSAVPAPDSLRSPGYPLFLYAFLDPVPTYAALDAITRAQALLAVFSVFLVYLVSRRFLGEAGAITAAALTTLSPHLATVNTYLLSEPLFTFLLLCSVHATGRALETARTAWFATAGIALALASLTRPTLQFLPLFLIALTVAWPPMRGRLKGLLLMFVVMLVVMSPWLARNLQTPHKDGEPSLAINFLHHGSYPGFMYKDNPFTINAPYRYDPDSARISRNMGSVLRHIADGFKSEPGKFLHWYLLGKPGYFLSWTITDGYSDIYTYHIERSPFLDQAFFAGMRDLMFWLHWPLTLAAIAAMVLLLSGSSWLGLSAHQRTAALAPMLFLLYAIALHMVGAPFPRYGIPFRPLVYVLAMLVLLALWRRWNLGARHPETGLR